MGRGGKAGQGQGSLSCIAMTQPTMSSPKLLQPVMTEDSILLLPLPGPPPSPSPVNLPPVPSVHYMSAITSASTMTGSQNRPTLLPSPTHDVPSHTISSPKLLKPVMTDDSTAPLLSALEFSDCP